MVMISENFGSLLEPKLREVFFEQYNLIPSRIPQLFNVQSSTKAVETDYGIGAFSEFKEFTGSIDYDDLNALWEVTYTPKEFAKGFKVERKLIEDNQYRVAFGRAENLGQSAFRKREADAVSVFANAFTAGATAGYDAVALCSATHDYSPSIGTHQSNTGTTALTRASIITTRNLMREWTDDRGNRIYINPDMLIVPIELEDTAYRAIQSAGVAGTGDNDENMLRGRFQIFSWELLTDANNWFLVDSQLMKRSLMWFDRVPLEFGQATEFDTMLAKYRAYMRYSFGWSEWRFIYGQSVT